MQRSSCSRWRNGAQDRLYGWLTNAQTPRVELGYVDLKTGRLVPSGAEVIPGRAATKTVLLGHLARKSIGPLGLPE